MAGRSGNSGTSTRSYLCEREFGARKTVARKIRGVASRFRRALTGECCQRALVATERRNEEASPPGPPLTWRILETARPREGKEIGRYFGFRLLEKTMILPASDPQQGGRVGHRFSNAGVRASSREKRNRAFRVGGEKQGKTFGARIRGAHPEARTERVTGIGSRPRRSL